MKKLWIFITLIAFCSPVSAWDGYDYQSGDYIEIGPGNLVRDGLEIEFYDYQTGQYHSADVESIQQIGTALELEVYDHDSGQYRIFEMDQ